MEAKAIQLASARIIGPPDYVGLSTIEKIIRKKERSEKEKGNNSHETNKPDVTCNDGVCIDITPVAKSGFFTIIRKLSANLISRCLLPSFTTGY